MFSVPDILKQKCLEVDKSSSHFLPYEAAATQKNPAYDTGKILIWRGRYKFNK